VEEAICYHLDSKVGHLVGTVIGKSRGIEKVKATKRNMMWYGNFPNLGETNVPYHYLLEGNKLY
jgi:hypothetical protein